jgi:type I restriction enzyme S subunit
LNRARMTPIGEVVETVQTWNPGKKLPDGSFIYIDLSAVNQGTKQIEGHRLVDSAVAPSRARQLVARGDVLVSTVRPNLNTVAVVPDELDGAIASTGFCVLRPRPRKLESRYLLHWVRTPAFIQEMVKRATGASYPAVSDQTVRDSLIPLPPTAEQRRLADILDRADCLRSLRGQAIVQLEALAQSIFLAMFGRSSPTWQVATVGELGAGPNAIRTGPFGSQLLHSEFVSSGVAVLGIDNAVANEFRWGAERFITEEKYERLRRYTIKPRDVLITIMGTCGRCAVVPNDIPVAISTKHLCCISPNEEICMPEYLHAYFLRHPVARTYLQKATRGAIMSGLNMTIIKSMPIPLPPMVVQREFVARLDQIQQLRTAQRSSGAELESLFASLQSRGFGGHL